ncbi:hypothetical protein L7F22_063746 [Adiantum nelumboides]|nr:hypothetical protein [Adiantum nelumboides]
MEVDKETKESAADTTVQEEVTQEVEATIEVTIAEIAEELQATDYLTKWAEAIAIRKNYARTTAAFLYENVFTRYGLPIEIVSNRGTHFLNEVIEYLLSEFIVIHNKSAPYHPQANGQAEHTNKILSSV